SDLTDNDFIEKRLDPKLRANAYTILAISQWRSGDLKGAKATVETAQGLEFDGRDKVLIEMVLPLIYEQELLSKYSQLDPKRISETEYSTIYEPAFVEIADRLKQVTAINAGDGDDEAWEIIWYVHYQRWRVLSNWRIVIAGLWDGSDFDSSTSWNLRNEARERASAKLGGVELKEASQQELETIPADHPLRKLAESLMR
ncbi:MAG: hypothetical protein GY801_35105, partial [bacterium]|nr:hypothetical protein [bacterium]